MNTAINKLQYYVPIKTKQMDWINQTTYHNKEIVKLIEDQQKTLNDLLEAIKPYQDNASVKKIIDGLKPIEATYKNLDKDGFNKKQVIKIQNKIGELRNDLIS